MRAIIISIIFFSLNAFADCQPLVIDGFREAKSQGDLKLYVNQEKTATLAIRCFESKTSPKEVANEFSKTGPVTKIHDDLLFTELRTPGVISRSYLKVGKTCHQLSLVVNEKSSTLTKLHEQILNALTTK